MQTRLATINLFTNTPKELSDFYKTVFDLKEIDFLSKPPDLFVIDGKGCHICLKFSPKQGLETTVNTAELCFEVQDPLQTIIRLKANGGTILSEENNRSGLAFCAADPKGNLLVVHYCFYESSHYYSNH